MVGAIAFRSCRIKANQGKSNEVLAGDSVTTSGLTAYKTFQISLANPAEPGVALPGATATGTIVAETPQTLPSQFHRRVEIRRLPVAFSPPPRSANAQPIFADVSGLTLAQLAQTIGVHLPQNGAGTVVNFKAIDRAFAEPWTEITVKVKIDVLDKLFATMVADPTKK